MKLSKETLTILKNYAVINSNIVFREGNRQFTSDIRNAKADSGEVKTKESIFSIVNIKEEFPVDFGIYDLNEFLGVVSLFESPDLDFNDKFVTISENGNSIKYFAAEKSVVAHPKKEFANLESDVKFPLSSQQLAMIQKTSSILKTGKVLNIIGDGVSVNAIVGDIKNITGNSYQTYLGDTDRVFNIILNVDRLKFLPINYDVYVIGSGDRVISKFVGNDNIVYYVAVEIGSRIESPEDAA